LPDISHNSNPPCRIHTVRLWFKAFIPRDIEGTKTVTTGPHKGKTMLSSPGPIAAWFLTDGRGFNAAPEAQARMHSEIEIDFVNFKILREFHKCDPTIQVNPETGDEECHETAESKDMSFSELNIQSQTATIKARLKGSTKNACLKVAAIKIAPNLDYDGEIWLSLDEKKQALSVRFEGQIETYPAFEMYVAVNGGKAVPLFQLPVEKGATAVSLIGAPQRSVDVSTTIACQPAG
jgi:hypothetical protein